MSEQHLTLVEKIATRYATGLGPNGVARSGSFVMIRPRHIMTHDNTGAVMPKFRQMAGDSKERPAKVCDPRQPVFAIDHDIQNVTPENLGKYAKIEQFARAQGIDFFPAGTGIAHQIMIEQGYVVPGSMVVGSDSHSNIYGGLSALGTPVVRTDAASVWATGETWWQVPPVAKVALRGHLRPGVVGKDVIIALCGLFSHDEVLNHAVEFVDVEGGIAAMSIDERLSIANMSTEWGALAGVFPFDATLLDWLLARAEALSDGEKIPGSRGGYTRADVERWWQSRRDFAADPDAHYAIELELDLGTIVPHVCGPNDVRTIVALPDIEAKRIPVHKAWLMSCVNGRYADLVAAADVVRGKRIAPGVEFYLAAASSVIERQAKASGVWSALVDAGAIELPPGCGTCIGLGKGLIRKGEVGISSTNRNFEGRMGDREGAVYLASPAVVAASAIAGFIAAPQRFAADTIRWSTRTVESKSAAPAAVDVIDGFPPVVKGRVLFLDRDHLNTDGIFAGKHTYNDAITPAEMTKVIFENYDPSFLSIAKPGDIIVSGRNFGTGSSREQAATALKHFGIPCVIAASFSETYKRNAFNNGFVVFECPEFVEFLRERLAVARGLTKPGPEITIDYRASAIRCDDRSFSFPPLSPVAQELVVAGGAENVVARRLAAAT
jgi:homoaconitate hydratase